MFNFNREKNIILRPTLILYPTSTYLNTYYLISSLQPYNYNSSTSLSLILVPQVHSLNKIYTLIWGSSSHFIHSQNHAPFRMGIIIPSIVSEKLPLFNKVREKYIFVSPPPKSSYQMLPETWDFNRATVTAVFAPIILPSCHWSRRRRHRRCRHSE